MAGNSYLTLRAPIEIDYSATTSAGFSMSKATSKVKVARTLIRGMITEPAWLGSNGQEAILADGGLVLFGQMYEYSRNFNTDRGLV